MQAALAPIIGGSAAGASSLALGAQALGPIFGAFNTFGQMRDMRAQEAANLEIAKTRADQTDTAARVGLEDDISSYRAALSANDAGASVATLGILNGVRQAKERERRIMLSNERIRQGDAQRRRDSYRPGMALARGFAQSSPSLFQFYGSLR